MNDDLMPGNCILNSFGLFGIDPNDLVPGVDYAIAKKIPLMPTPDPSGDEAMTLLKEVKWLKGMVPFRVGEKHGFKTGTWYPVTRIGATETADTGKEFWINMNAICGALLLPVSRTGEVEGAQ